MACTNCLDPNAEIGDCPPFANRADIVRILENFGNQTCCVGQLSENLNPTDPEQTVEAFDQAFPDGITNCTCGCIWMVYDDGEIFNTYQNCYGQNNWLNSSAWCDDCGGSTCLGHLTTVGLDPSDGEVSAAQAVLEAFPSGLPCPDCDTAIIFREDGSLCHSVDCGETWDCSGEGIVGAYSAGNGGSLYTPCTGCGGTVPCTSDRTYAINLFFVSPEQDVVSVQATESHLGVLLNCSGCVNGIRKEFRVAQSGNYLFNFSGVFVGNFALGGSGCSNCDQTGTSGGLIRLMDEANNVIYSQGISSVFGQSEKVTVEVMLSRLLFFDSTKEYHISITHNRLDSSCCPNSCPSPTYNVIGRYSTRYFNIELIEP